MDKNYFGNIEIFSKAAVDSSKALGEINTKVFEQLAQKNMDMFNFSVEAGNRWMANLGKTKDYQALAAEQIKLFGELNGKIIETVKDATKVIVDSRDEYQAWMESGVKLADDMLKTSIPKKAA